MIMIPTQLISADIHVTFQGISYCNDPAGSSTEYSVDTKLFPKSIYLDNGSQQTFHRLNLAQGSLSGSKVPSNKLTNLASNCQYRATLELLALVHCR